MPLPPTPAAATTAGAATAGTGATAGGALHGAGPTAADMDRLVSALGKDIGAALERAGERLDYLWRNPDKLHYLMTGFPDDLEGTFAQEKPSCQNGCGDDEPDGAKKEDGPGGADSDGPRQKDLDELAEKVKERTEQRLNDPLNEKHLDAAIRERNGEVVSRKSGGDPYDHVTEVDDARRGLKKDIKKLENKIEHYENYGDDEKSLGSLEDAKDVLDYMNDIQRYVDGRLGGKVK